MVASHPIFRTPFPVELTLHDMATPAHYRRHPDFADLGDTMPAWLVHAEEMGPYIGVVADGYSFEDSPDAEWIASGTNSKNARAVALGRQGNFFHWGFSASPLQMTEQARTVFLNTLAYMAQFDGHVPVAVGKGKSREWLRVFAARIDESTSTYARSQLPTSWLEATGDDKQKLQALCEAELQFVWHDGKHWVVDEHCKVLGLDNRDPRTLRRCADLLATDSENAAARHILGRYTDQRFASAAEWQRWLDDCDGRLFHSDRNGRFAVTPADYPTPYRIE